MFIKIIKKKNYLGKIKSVQYCVQCEIKSTCSGQDIQGVQHQNVMVILSESDYVSFRCYF